MARNLTTGLQRGLRRSIAGGLGASDLFSVAPLDLRFAQQKTLDPRVTFTRASSGTYVGSDGLIKTATTNEARFDHNPTTGESLGLLVEEQRTNLLLYSACDSNWSTGGFGTATYNLGLSALGVFSGVQIASAGQNWHSLYRTGISLTASTIYAFTLFYRAGTSGRVRLVFRNNTTTTETVINGTAGNLSVSAAFAGAATVLSQYLYSDGLTYVVTGTYTPNSTSTDHWYRVGPDSTTTGQTVIALGGQLEAGSFPTSYIPTTTATVTRSADVASITGANFSSWYNQTEGTVYFSAKTNFAVPSGPFPRVVQIQGATGNDRIEQSFYSGGQVCFVRNSAAVQAEWYPNYFIQNGVTSSIALATNNIAGSSNGAITGTDSVAVLPTVDRMQIGAETASTNILNGTIRRLTYWPSRLPNATLQQITR